MDLAVVIVFYLFVVFALVNTKGTRFARDVPLSGKNITTAIISKSQRVMEVDCARVCVDLGTCESFFYNTVTEECQYHDVVFTTSAGASDQEGVEYYYVIKEHNDWCPVEDGFLLLTDNRTCVKIHSDLKTWYEANDTCASYSPFSRLVVLDNQEKNDLVRAAGMAMDNQFTRGLWMGLSEHAENDYRWIGGKTLVFTDWLDWDSSSLGQEDCVWINRAYGYHWRRLACTETGHNICEFVVDVEKYLVMMFLE